MMTVLWLESACVMWADLSAWPSQVPSTRHAALLNYGPVYNTAHSVCRINLCTTHLTAQPTDFINVIVCFCRNGWQSASAVHSLVRHSITRSASTSEHSTMSAVILIISYPAYFLRSLIIQLNIECFINSEFFINSSLIFPYFISPPIFTIHR